MPEPNSTHPNSTQLTSTHDVFNQSQPFEDVNLYLSDQAFVGAVRREGGIGAEEGLARLGAIAGSKDAAEWARLANANPPVLRTHDSKGHRLDIVEYHPAYHVLMETSFAESAHRLESGPGANVIRAAKVYLCAQMEAGHCCPITMTNAAAPVVKRLEEAAVPWLPKAAADTYDRRFLPVEHKTSVTFGMGMTEKQGGSDVRANTTRATPEGARGPGRPYTITGHKWFMSAPMSDAFLILAQATGGLTCFFMPRFRPDGSVNALHFQRLKSKLGNRSNASSEVEFHGAYALALSEEGEGTRVIIEMVTATRLDCVVSSAALMRSAVAHALHHAGQRSAFQKKLIDQPLMQHVLADLVLDCEAATALSFRLARAFDHAADETSTAWRRLMTPAIKYWVCKIAPPFVAEAMECLGGNGYVEEAPLARIYREVPVNSIWEGSGNIMALDVVRVLKREPDSARLVLAEIAIIAGADRDFNSAIERWAKLLEEPELFEVRARQIAEGLALLAGAALLRAHAPAAVADAFVGSRLGDRSAHTYGARLGAGDTSAVLARARPGV